MHATGKTLAFDHAFVAALLSYWAEDPCSGMAFGDLHDYDAHTIRRRREDGRKSALPRNAICRVYLTRSIYFIVWFFVIIYTPQDGEAGMMEENIFTHVPGPRLEAAEPFHVMGNGTKRIRNTVAWSRMGKQN